MSSEIILKSGRKFYANLGIIGIGPELNVTEGYDGGVPTADKDYLDDAMSPAEMVELADLMLDRWQRFRAKWSADSATKVYSPVELGIDLTPSKETLDLIDKIERDAYEAERSMRDFIVGRPPDPGG